MFTSHQSLHDGSKIGRTSSRVYTRDLSVKRGVILKVVDRFGILIGTVIVVKGKKPAPSRTNNSYPEELKCRP